MALARKYGVLARFGLFAADVALAFAAAVFASYMTLPSDGATSFWQHFHWHLTFYQTFVVVWCGAASANRLYSSQRVDSLPAQLWAVTKAVAFALAFTGFLSVFLMPGATARVFLLYFSSGTFVSILLFRLIFRLFVASIRSAGFNRRRVVLVGANERTRHLVDLLVTRAHYGYSVVGVLEDDPKRAKLLRNWDVPHIGGFEVLERLLLESIVDEVYISLPVRSQYENIVSMAHLCEGAGIPVRVVADMFTLQIATNRFYLLKDIPIQSLSPVPEASLEVVVKHFIDVAAAAAGLLVLGPLLFLPVAIWIKLDSPGPVFFGQKRLGVNGRHFVMLKFRSMVADAERRRKDLEALNEADGPVFKMRADPRVTRVGKFIRKYSIDEFPQLINVLKGEMSLVGPRPLPIGEIEKHSWGQRRRLSVKPGMTGLWQVSGRSDVSFKEWLDLDLTYIDSWSLAQDFWILLRTFRAVAQGRGAA